MPTVATIERRRLADALGAAGPDAPTLCEGWTTRDLAAHIVLRDRRPDAAAGLVVPALSGHTRRVQDRIVRRDWDRLVDQVRNGPPAWSLTRWGPVDRLANTVEFFVHHEDVRRASTGWVPRDLDDDLTAELGKALRRMAKLVGRRTPVPVTLEPDAGEPVVVKAGEPTVVVRGPVAELVLWANGRQERAAVGYDGPTEAVDAVRQASLGI